MKIKPLMIGSLPLMIDGEVRVVPLHIFASSGGDTTIRIGDNVLVFDQDGELHTAEARFRSEQEAQGYPEALEGALRGDPPGDTYYRPGTVGWRKESDSQNVLTLDRPRRIGTPHKVDKRNLPLLGKIKERFLATVLRHDAVRCANESKMS